MRKSYSLQVLALAAVLAVAGVAGFVGAQNVAVKPQPAKVAVLDVKNLFENLEEKRQIEDKINEKRKGLNDESVKRKKEIDQIQADLQTVLKPGTPAFGEKEEELARKAIDFQAWSNFQTKKLQTEMVTSMEGLYRKMVDTIAVVAKQGGYDLVLYKEQDPNFRGAQPEALSTLITLRKVLYAAESLDVTDLVTQKMNNEFKNRK